ncbi:MAG: thiamine pyrophosphate-dependent enzyme [Thermomicrobiales bacterium]
MHLNAHPLPPRGRRADQRTAGDSTFGHGRVGWCDQIREVQAVRKAAASVVRGAEGLGIDVLCRAISDVSGFSIDMTMRVMSRAVRSTSHARSLPEWIWHAVCGASRHWREKSGRPDAAVVAVVGDGGFQYTMGDLGCAVQERLGLPIVIFNDSTYQQPGRSDERDGRYMAVDPPIRLREPSRIWRCPRGAGNSPQSFPSAR